MSGKGLAVTRSFEGCALRAYRDSAGVWTIGYGITNYDTWAVRYLGRKIGPGMVITQEQAEYLLVQSIQRNYMPDVESVLGTNQQVIDGGGIFHFNTGAIKRASWVKLFLAGKPFESSLMSWNRAGGKVLRGLTRRRAREYAIITRGDYGPEATAIPPRIGDAGQVLTVPAGAGNHFLAGTPGMLRQGDAGPEVADLNANLAKLGFGTRGPVFDATTDSAVRAFQKRHPQLTVDGVAGPATRAAINRAIAMAASTANTSGAAGGAALAAAAADTLSGGGVGAGVYIGVALAAVCVALVIAWRYRDELIAVAKR